MKIAVLLGGIGYDSQQRTINGILDKALIDRTNVYIFTCEGWKYEHPSVYEKGEYNVYTLPDFTQYDGVVLNSDTIHNTGVVENIVKKIEEAGIPCVDLNLRHTQFMHVEMENRGGMEEIVRHLIKCHGARNIFFISGPVHNQDACMRLQAYKDTMEANHLAYGSENIYYGDYSFESGRKAVHGFLERAHELPDAVVAANDEMAVGAVLALKEAGYRVPEDVMVTGYDDSVIAEYNSPRLTTVRRGEYEAGQIAYEKIAAALRGEKVEQSAAIQGHPVFAGSCGCDIDEEFGVMQMRKRYIESHVKTYEDMEMIKNSSVEFTGLTGFDDLLESLEQYICNIGIEYFYLCRCGNLDDYYKEMERLAAGKELDRDVAVYSDKLWVPFAYEQGRVNCYGEFHRSELLPEECTMKRSGAFYIVMPLHFQDYCYGYCVAGNYRPAFEGRFYQNFILNLDNALETVRKQDMMRAMLQRLNRMWVCDELTGVYNRAGFYERSAKLLDEARTEQKSVGIIFADVDGLKKVNDTYGHEQGDILIKAMASVLEQTLHRRELLCRYGGDEFIIMMTGYEENDVQNDVARIQKAITNYNMLHARPYELSASLGYCVGPYTENLDLEEIMKRADEEMYRTKRAKKIAESAASQR